MKRLSLLSIVAALAFSPCFAEEAPVKEVPDEAASGGEKKASGSPFQALLDHLEARFKERWKEVDGVKLPVQYINAKTKLKEALMLEKDDPKAPELKQWAMACSLQVELALMELSIIGSQDRLQSIQDQRDSLQNEIAGTYQKINQIERGYASNLKEDLDKQRLQMLKRQEEARKRFDALESDVIQVKKDARGIILSMSDILFDVGKSTLKTNLKTNLAKIAGILTVYKQANVIVEGHTDNQGTAEYNQKLSEDRANAVMGFLVEQGLEEARFTAVGYGFTKPVADNATREGRQQNRRVDLIIAEKKQPE